MNNDIKVKLCQDDFYLMMRNAVLQAGGGDNVDKWKGMKLEELVKTLAQNGIRIVHMPEKHMDAVKIVWESTKSKTNWAMTCLILHMVPSQMKHNVWPNAILLRPKVLMKVEKLLTVSTN